MAAAQDVTLEYRVHSDFAQGGALAFQHEFINEFNDTHPDVTIKAMTT